MSGTDSNMSPADDPINFPLTSDEGTIIPKRIIPTVANKTTMGTITEETGVVQEQTFHILRPEELEQIESKRLRLPEVIHLMNALPMIHLEALSPEERSCVICQEPFTTDGYNCGAPASQTQLDVPTRLPCPGRHVFGFACISQWFLDHSDCPCCRHRLFELSPELNLEHTIALLELVNMRQMLRPQDVANKNLL